MPLKTWWRGAFEKGVYPLKSLENNLQWRTKTRRQVVFLKKVLGLRPDSKVLDVACGQGRHALLLAQGGCQATGVDISPVYLSEARKQAARLKVKARFLRQDMRRLRFRREFDAAINMFSSFGYFSKAGDDLNVLRGIYAALKPGGYFLLDTINGPRILRHFVANKWTEWSDGMLILEDCELVRRKRAVKTRWIFIRNGYRKEMISLVRMYDNKSLGRLLKKAGFRIVRFYGETAVAPYRPLHSPRLVVLAQRPFDAK
ncbi:MAG: class I SAM-dependent methyltransferase [Elusimicrobia bacterium]|nr:class I SAM-dependent methyltransferase [Elusimicrobiota bacterium]